MRHVAVAILIVLCCVPDAFGNHECSVACSEEVACPSGLTCCTGECERLPARVEGAPCDATPCGQCMEDLTCINGVCTLRTVGYLCGCQSDADCARGSQCASGQCVLAGILPGRACSETALCITGNCTNSICYGLNQGASCSVIPDNCAVGYFCDPNTLTCQQANPGGACSSNLMCLSGLCNFANTVGGAQCVEPQSRGLGQSCTVNAMCQTNLICSACVCANPSNKMSIGQPCGMYADDRCDTSTGPAFCAGSQPGVGNTCPVSGTCQTGSRFALTTGSACTYDDQCAKDALCVSGHCSVGSIGANCTAGSTNPCTTQMDVNFSPYVTCQCGTSGFSTCQLYTGPTCPILSTIESLVNVWGNYTWANVAVAGNSQEKAALASALCCGACTGTPLANEWDDSYYADHVAFLENFPAAVNCGDPQNPTFQPFGTVAGRCTVNNTVEIAFGSVFLCTSIVSPSPTQTPSPTVTPTVTPTTSPPPAGPNGLTCESGFILTDGVAITKNLNPLPSFGTNTDCPGDKPGYWYTYTATATQTVDFTFCGDPTSNGGTIIVYDACTSQPCTSPPDTGNCKTVSKNVNSGSVYYVWGAPITQPPTMTSFSITAVGISATPSTTPAPSISASPSPSPVVNEPGLLCTDPLPLPLGSTTIFAGTPTGGQNTAATCSGFGRWFHYFSPYNQTIDFVACASFMAGVAVTTSCDAATTCGAPSNAGGSCPSGVAPYVWEIVAMANTDYYIWVGSTLGTLGPFNMSSIGYTQSATPSVTPTTSPSATPSPSVAMQGLNCPQAIPLTVGSAITVEIAETSASGFNPGCDNTPHNYGRWFSYLATGTDPIGFSTCMAPTSFATFMSIQSACGGSECSAAPLLQSCTQGQMVWVPTPVSGTTYYVWVSSDTPNTLSSFGIVVNPLSTSPSPTSAASVTPTISQTSSHTPSHSPSTTETRTPSPSSTRTRSESNTMSSSLSSSVSASSSFTNTASASATPSPTSSISRSTSAAPSLSALPSQSTTPSNTPSNTPSESITASSSRTPSQGSSLSATRSRTPDATRSPSPSPSGTTSPTRSVTPSTSQSPTRTVTPTVTPSTTPSVTPTPVSESASPSVGSSRTATASVSRSASTTSTASATASMTSSVTATQTSSSTTTATASVSTTATASISESASLSVGSSRSPSTTASETPSNSNQPSSTAAPSRSNSGLPSPSSGTGATVQTAETPAPKNVGAIAGGVVGGVVGLVCIGIGLWWVCRPLPKDGTRKRRGSFFTNMREMEGTVDNTLHNDFEMFGVDGKGAMPPPRTTPVEPPPRGGRRPESDIFAADTEALEPVVPAPAPAAVPGQDNDIFAADTGTLPPPASPLPIIRPPPRNGSSRL